MTSFLRVKDLREMTLAFQDGFSGTSAIDDASIANLDTVLGVDTHILRDARTIVPVGARFTTAGIATVRTVTNTQNSQQWTLDLTTAVVVGGTFDITLNGATSSAVAFDVTGSALQALLEALGGIGVGQITVAEASGPIHTITFAGTLANIATNTLTVDGASLTNADTEVVINTQTGLITWEVTFTPALVTAFLPSNDDAMTWYPRRLFFEVETGDLAWTEGANPIARKSRGILSGLRKGEDQEIDVTSAFVFDWMRSQTTDLNPLTDITPHEVLHNVGFASDWLPSSHGSVCEPPSVDIVVIDRPACGSQQAEIFIFPQFAFTNISPSVQGGIVNFSGMSIAEFPIIKRVANTDDAIGIIF